MKPILHPVPAGGCLPSFPSSAGGDGNLDYISEGFGGLNPLPSRPSRLHPRGVLGGGRAWLPRPAPSFPPSRGFALGHAGGSGAGSSAAGRGARAATGGDDASSGAARSHRLSGQRRPRGDPPRAPPPAPMAGRAPQRSLPAAAAAALLLLPVSAGAGEGAARGQAGREGRAGDAPRPRGARSVREGAGDVPRPLAGPSRPSPSALRDLCGWRLTEPSGILVCSLSTEGTCPGGC